MSRRLVNQAHAWVSEALRPGDVAIDATLGNGHDSLHLARCVGRGGRVMATDTQQLAIDSARQLFQSKGIENVQICLACHSQLAHLVPAELRDRIGAVMFNLGYLPGGDQRVTTRSESTLPAIKAAVELLRPGGVLTVVAYTGHEGGTEEAEAVASLLVGLNPAAFVRMDDPQQPIRSPEPRLMGLRKWASAAGGDL